MRAILGIGNPGAQYAMTRHNAGFMVLDRIATEQALDWERHKKWQAQLTTWRHPAARTLLLKPQTYVNRSGATLQAAMTFHKLHPEEVLVVVDYINLSLGTVRARAAGSAGGHNGLKDIEARIGRGYPRLRLGIGAPGLGQVDHVLGVFEPDERPAVTRMLAAATRAIEAWLESGIEACMRHNGPTTPPEAAAAPPRDEPPSAGVDQRPEA